MSDRKRLPLQRWLVGGATMLLAACGSGTGSTTSTATPPVHPNASATPAATSTATATPAPTAVPTSAATPTATSAATATAAAACWPLRGGSGERASISDVRVGAASGRNRLVVEFTTAVPAYELTLNPGGTRFAMTGSGEGVTLAGSSGIALHIRDLDWANDRYASGRDLTPRYTTLQEVRVVGDFEGQADIAIGVSAALCPTVTELAGPPRLVVDFPAA